ncbi:MAG: ferric reductase-like transmembrane domain-containing protein [Candidatus Nanopelagicales bacterium]|jgi:DMSO/TMAO reductase YedYZ heme-binding membrane subunit|nr:ferric reductase-like transmembrane domain-containing protein [Candidatus Nanopelagicales bacterium]MCU0298049.1 ferric reductase-like transmembrane domain-containing protein [Candidatus Nanopelagicales bacterium]
MTWEIIRVTGLLALALLTVSVSLGIAGPAIHRPSARLTSVSLHLTAGVAGTLLVVAHVAFAVIDSWVDVPALAVFVPGASPWQTLWVAVGTIAFDLMLVIAATSALRQQAPDLWRRAHLLAYPTWALVWVHTLTIGTDRGTALMVGMAAASAGAVAASVALRRLNRPVQNITTPQKLEAFR